LTRLLSLFSPLSPRQGFLIIYSCRYLVSWPWHFAGLFFKVYFLVLFGKILHIVYNIRISYSHRKKLFNCQWFGSKFLGFRNEYRLFGIPIQIWIQS
jgi:hypothetical protein